MTTHITIILAMLLSAFHTPMCHCHGQGLNDLSSEANGVEQCCHHSSPDTGVSLPCPARPDCCCRVHSATVAIDSLESGVAVDAHQVICHFRDGVVSVRCMANVREVLASSTTPGIDTGGSAVLLRTQRLLI